MEHVETAGIRGHSAIWRIGGLVALVIGALIAGYALGWLSYSDMLEHVEHLRKSQNLPAFLAVFIGGYAVGTALGLPGLPFNVAAGALFGTLIGGGIAWASSLIGASIGYWIARTIAHDEVLRWVRRFKRADAAVSQARDFLGLLRLRLIPVLPIGTINFAGGLARAPFGAYIAATALGIIPSVAIYSYFADSLLEGVGSGRTSALVSLIIASALLILLSLAPKLYSARKVTAGSTADARRAGM